MDEEEGQEEAEEGRVDEDGATTTFLATVALGGRWGGG